MTGDVALSVNLGHVIMALLGASMWIIYNNINAKFDNILSTMREREAGLREHIAQGDRANDDASRERFRRHEDRINALDTTISQLPGKIEALSNEIKRLELIMATHYSDQSKISARRG